MINFEFNPNDKNNSETIHERVSTYLDSLEEYFREEYIRNVKQKDRPIWYRDIQENDYKDFYYVKQLISFVNIFNNQEEMSLIKQIDNNYGKQENILNLTGKITRITQLKSKYGYCLTVIVKDNFFAYLKNLKSFEHLCDIFEKYGTTVFLPIVVSISGSIGYFNEKELKDFEKKFEKLKEKLRKIEINLEDKEIEKKLIEIIERQIKGTGIVLIIKTKKNS